MGSIIDQPGTRSQFNKPNKKLYFAGKLGIYLNKNVKKNNFSRKGPMIGQPCDSVKSQEALF